MGLILASATCDPSTEIICAPENVRELFEFRTPIFYLGPLPVTRTVFLILLTAVIVSLVLYFGLRKKSVVPGKFQVIVEAIVSFVKDGIAVDIIGEHGAKFAPWLLSIFLFVLMGNLYEVTPFVNFPITSRIAIPAFLALLTWVVFVVAGVKRQGFRYVIDIAWPKSVPVALRPLVGLIELVSTFILRPITLAVRLTLLLASGWIFISHVGEIGVRAAIGIPWFILGLGIYVFEIVVIMLQAYIFTLLSAVYVQTSLYPDH